MKKAASMLKDNPKCLDIICDLFNALTIGGIVQQMNFKKEINAKEYWKCLKKIEGNGIGKGRFSQKFASVCTIEHIPEYIEEAIEYIYKKVIE